jgi:hypothetical protein
MAVDGNGPGGAISLLQSPNQAGLDFVGHVHLRRG